MGARSNKRDLSSRKKEVSGATKFNKPIAESSKGKMDAQPNRSRDIKCDTSHKGPTQAQERDELKLLQGPITRSKARQMCMKLNRTIPNFISKALDAYTKEKENQDSLSCFQENQETESWPNLVIRPAPGNGYCFSLQARLIVFASST